MYRRMAKAEREAEVFRQAAGYLVVGDRKLVHGFSVETYDSFTRKWRLYLPDNHRYVLKFVVGNMLPQGKPDGKIEEFPIEGSGEFLVSAEILHSKNDNGRLLLSYQSEKLDLEKGVYSLEHGHLMTSVPISSEVMKKLETDAPRVISRFGSKGTETSDSDKPIILTRERCMKSLGPKTWTSSDEPMPGFMIWLEEQK